VVAGDKNMTDAERKAEQNRARVKRWKKNRQAEGYKHFTAMIRPEWYRPLMNLIKELKSEK
jgi:hypothetical protein